MTSIALCPNCGGQKTVSKPPYIAGDVNSWAAIGTPTYPYTHTQHVKDVDGFESIRCRKQTSIA